ncbi:hypothetical protein J8273_8277 [Carpediemonas membranifera]|uniref:Uncharacterized protein n=1 Tax=Carpediemonas membranifera TaxID=201153 RepID=A0A8J6B546_9EUKA|nr:hypothetical protein J8273_8277 [Carpediemonas membranifera]|eukprot:KAG9390237.1 hypothetical protein J8273_8277 [Carpediemonas membranifera]
MAGLEALEPMFEELDPQEVITGEKLHLMPPAPKAKEMTSSLVPEPVEEIEERGKSPGSEHGIGIDKIRISKRPKSTEPGQGLTQVYKTDDSYSFQPLPRPQATGKALPQEFQAVRASIVHECTQIFKSASAIRNKSFRANAVDELDVSRLMNLNQERIIGVRRMLDGLVSMSADPDPLLEEDMSAVADHLGHRLARVMWYHDNASKEAANRIERRRAKTVRSSSAGPSRPRTAPLGSARVPFPAGMLKQLGSAASTPRGTPVGAMQVPYTADDLESTFEMTHKPLYTPPQRPGSYKTESLILRRLSTTPTSGRRSRALARDDSAASIGEKRSSTPGGDSTLIGELMESNRIPPEVQQQAAMTVDRVRAASSLSGHLAVPSGAIVGPAGEGAGFIGSRPSEFEIEFASGMVPPKQTPWEQRVKGENAADMNILHSPGTAIARAGGRNRTPPRRPARPVPPRRYVISADQRPTTDTKMSSSIRRPRPPPTAPDGRPAWNRPMSRGGPLVQPSTTARPTAPRRARSAPGMSRARAQLESSQRLSRPRTPGTTTKKEVKTIADDELAYERRRRRSKRTESAGRPALEIQYDSESAALAPGCGRTTAAEDFRPIGLRIIEAVADRMDNPPEEPRTLDPSEFDARLEELALPAPEPRRVGGGFELPDPVSRAVTTITHGRWSRMKETETEPTPARPGAVQDVRVIRANGRRLLAGKPIADFCRTRHREPGPGRGSGVDEWAELSVARASGTIVV